MLVWLCRSWVTVSTGHVTWRNLSSDFKTARLPDMSSAARTVPSAITASLTFPLFFCGGIYKNIRTKITHILLMNWNETSKAVSWTLWHKLNIRLFVTWGRKWMLASLSMVGISSPYRKTVGFQLQNKNFKHVQILVIVNLKKKVCGFSKTP